MPDEISRNPERYFQERGVRVLAGHLVQSIEPDENGVTVTTDQGETLRVDGVVAGLGIRPNMALAQAAGLATGDGIQVDAAMRTSHPDIFAAGDVANFYSPVLDKRMRVEHEENANLTGMLAGQGMAGQPGRYETLPSVYSTLFDHPLRRGRRAGPPPADRLRLAGAVPKRGGLLHGRQPGARRAAVEPDPRSGYCPPDHRRALARSTPRI